MKNTLKRLFLMCSSVVLAGAISLISNVQKADSKVAATSISEWAGDEDIRNSLEEVNITDSTLMSLNADTKLSGNVISFGPSIGAFTYYKSKLTYTNYKLSFDSNMGSKMADWQRLQLRCQDIPNLAGSTDGYFVVLSASSATLYKQKGTDKYYTLGYYAYKTEHLGEGVSTTLGDKFYHMDFEVYNRDDHTVVLNYALNGHHVFHYVDDGSITEDMNKKAIPTAAQKAFTEPAAFAFFMNSTASPWYLKGDFCNASFDETVLLGNPKIYSPNSTATLEEGKVSMASNQVAATFEEQGTFGAALKVTTKDTPSTSKVMAIAGFASKSVRENYESSDGLIIDIYGNKVIIREGTNTLVEQTLKTALTKEFTIKLMAYFVAGQSTLAIKINNEWISGASLTLKRASGYLSLFSFAELSYTANKEIQRNFRILFIGNSITNHGPNEAVNYHIGNATNDSWAMATSEPQYDYVHTVMKQVWKIPGYEKAEYMAINVALWEGAIDTTEYVGYYHAGAAFEADIIVGRLGENVVSNPNYFTFAHYYKGLLDFFNSTGKAKIVLTTKYWGSASHLSDDQVDMGTIQIARTYNYPLVRINDLGTIYADINNATADGEYYKNLSGYAPGGKTWYNEWLGWTDGVKQHPGMVGHKNIGYRVGEMVTRLIKGEDAYIDKFVPIDDGVYAEYYNSDLYGNVDGAYDLKPATYVTATDISANFSYKLDKNYYVYKAYNIETDGEIYRFEMPLQSDTTSMLSYKCYTLGSDNKTLTALSCNSTSDAYNDDSLTISGDINKVLVIAVQYDPTRIFGSNTFNDATYGSILKYMNKDNEKFVLDCSSLNYKNLTINRDTFSVLLSSGKDIEIKLALGSFVIERETFEVISKTTNNLYFSLQKLTAKSYATNAQSVLNTFTGVKGIETNEDNNVSSVYEAQISYNGRAGDALYINKGVEVQLYTSLTADQASNLVVATAVLPSIGSEVKNIATLDEDRYNYSDGVLTMKLSDFDSDLILATGGKESMSLSGSCKTTYKVGEELNLAGLKVTYTNRAGITETVDVTSDMITGFNSSSTGKLTLTVTYKGLTATFDVTISNSSGGCGGAIGGASLLICFLCAPALLVVKRREEE